MSIPPVTSETVRDVVREIERSSTSGSEHARRFLNRLITSHHIVGIMVGRILAIHQQEGLSDAKSSDFIGTLGLSARVLEREMQRTMCDVTATLPPVAMETEKKIQREILDSGDDFSYHAQHWPRVEQLQPVLTGFVEQSSILADPLIRQVIQSTFIVMYRLLESQIEADDIAGE